MHFLRIGEKIININTISFIEYGGVDTCYIMHTSGKMGTYRCTVAALANKLKELQANKEGICANTLGIYYHTL